MLRLFFPAGPKNGLDAEIAEIKAAIAECRKDEEYKLRWRRWAEANMRMAPNPDAPPRPLYGEREAE